MPPDAAASFFRMLGSFSPPWVVLILVAVILAWRLPDIIRELRRKGP